MRRILICLLLLGGAARADAPQLDGAFGLWLGGFKVGEMRLDTRAEENGWRADAAARAAGVVGWVIDVSTRAVARGGGDARRPVNRAFEISGDFGDGPQRIAMRRDGAALSVEADPPLREKWYNAKPRDLRGAMDPITGALAALGDAAPGAICAKTVPIYDSRRRFDLILGAPYQAGAEWRCDGRYRRVAGYKDKHLRLPDAPFTLHWSERDGVAVFQKLVAPTDLGAAVLRRIE